MTEPKNMEMLIQEIGGCGRYQILISFLVHGMKTVVCFTMLMMMFGAAQPDWWCVDDDVNITSMHTNMSFIDIGSETSNHSHAMLKSCVTSKGTRCKTFRFGDEIKTTVTEWSLVCGMFWVPSTTTSIQMAGLFSGHLGAGHLADAFGRKITLFSSLVILILTNAIGAFSTSWVMFAALRFFAGLGCSFFLTVQYSIMSEFALVKWRPALVAAPSWPIETVLLALVAWLTKDWKLLQIVTAVLGLPFLASWWFIPESFRWLLTKGKVAEAETVIGFIARINGRPVPDTTALIEKEKRWTDEQRSRRRYTLLDLCRSRRLLVVSLLLSAGWMTLTMVTYSIQFGIQKWSGDLYLNIFLYAITYMPTQVLTIPLSVRIGRKAASILCLGTCGIGAIAVALCQFVNMDEDLRGRLTNGFSLVASIGINTAWPHVQTMTIEMYPTVVRNIGYGVENMVARIGGVIGPQLILLDDLLSGSMYLVCAGMCLLAVLCTWPLRETKDRDLQDHLTDTRASDDSGSHEHSV